MIPQESNEKSSEFTLPAESEQKKTKKVPIQITPQWEKIPVFFPFLSFAITRSNNSFNPPILCLFDLRQIIKDPSRAACDLVQYRCGQG